MERSSSAFLCLALTLALVAGSVGHEPAGARSAKTCAGSAKGGEWPFLNQNLANTRHQVRESAIGADEAGSLGLAWRFSTADAGAEGSLQSTPIVDHGCVYVATGSGWIFALNADSGDLVWKHRIRGASLLALGAAYGNLYAFPYGRGGARALALDQFTGEVVWETRRLVKPAAKDGSSSEGQQPNSGPIAFDGMLFFSGSYAYGAVRVPLYFLDAHTGDVIKKFSMISNSEREEGYGCCATWATPAVDLKNKVMYIATADSESFTKQHDYNQSIVKVDADRRSPSLGKVLGVYRGVGERYVDEHSPYDFDQSPVCQTFGGPDDPAGGSSTSSSNSCGELDLDFGASPTLFSVDGTQMVADLQKAGVFHAVYAKNMEGAWRQTLAPPSALGNAATGAWDGESLFVSANGGNSFSFDSAGLPNWTMHHGGDAARYQPLTVANGVVYTVTNAGVLLGMSAATGAPVLEHPISPDVNDEVCFTLGTGVAVARNTVYTQCEPGWVVAYRPE